MGMMSCNGCRVLRKGCSENCSIRPCLQWIKNPLYQANATVFLAKFYGRAGLLNLLNAAPDNLRPAIFRSLLYEACGRIVNPIYGSVGLLWSGNWQLCQNTVEAVLIGSPIKPIPFAAATIHDGPSLKAYDIRHVRKDNDSNIHRVRARKMFKCSGTHNKSSRVRVGSGHDEMNRSTHHEEIREIGESLDLEETIEKDSLTCVKPKSKRLLAGQAGDGDDDIVLELTLGFTSFLPS